MARLVFAAGVTALALAAPPRQQTPYRGVVDLVSIYATVTDATGRLVPDLVKGDFVVKDNGRKLEMRGYIGTPMFGRTQTWIREH